MPFGKPVEQHERNRLVRSFVKQRLLDRDRERHDEHSYYLDTATPG